MLLWDKHIAQNLPCNHFYVHSSVALSMIQGYATVPTICFQNLLMFPNWNSVPIEL